MADYYIAGVSGDDSTGDGSSGNPYKTMAPFSEGSGDTVHFKENCPFTITVVTGATYQQWSGETQAVIDGGSSRTNCILASVVSDFTISGLHCTAATNYGIYTVGIAAGTNTIEDCTCYSNAKYGIYLRSTSAGTITVDSCTCYSNTEYNIGVAQGSGGTINIDTCTCYSSSTKSGIALVSNTGGTFTVSSCTSYSNDEHGIYIYNVSTAGTYVVEDCSFYTNTENGGYVDTIAAGSYDVRRCQFYGNTLDGLELEDVTGASSFLVQFCLVYENGGSYNGVNLINADSIQFFRLTVDTENYAFNMDAASTGVTLQGCIATSSTYGYNAGAGSSPSIDECQVYGCSTATAGDATTAWSNGNYNLTTDPDYVSAATDNYHLSDWDSPCVDSCNDLAGASSTDLDGADASVRFLQDRGCYEYTTLTDAPAEVVYTPSTELHATAAKLDVLDYSSGSPCDYTELYSWDTAGPSILMLFNGSLTATMDPDRAIQPAEQRNLYLYAWVGGTVTTYGTVTITGTDYLGGTISDVLSFTGTGQIVQTSKPFKTINVNGITSSGWVGTSLTLAVAQNRWGVVWVQLAADEENCNQYRIEVPVYFGDGTDECYFKDTLKTAHHYDKWQINNNATVTFGDTATVGGETIYKDGCRITVARKTSLSSWQHVKNGGTLNLYDSHLMVEPGSYTVQNGGTFTAKYSTISGHVHTDTDTKFSGAGLMSFERCNFHSSNRLNFSGSTEISDLHTYGNDRNLSAESFAEVWAINSNSFGSNTYDVYSAKTGFNFPGRFHIVNTPFTDSKSGLQDANGYIWVHKDFKVTVTDTSGTPIVGATVSLVNKSVVGNTPAGAEWLLEERAGQELDGAQEYNSYIFTVTDTTGLEIDDDFRVAETIHKITNISGYDLEINNGSGPSTGSRDTPLIGDKSGTPPNDYADGTQVYHFTPLETDSDGVVECLSKRSVYTRWASDTGLPPTYYEFNPMILRINEYGKKPYKVEKQILEAVDEGVALEDNSFITEGTYATVRAYTPSKITVNHTTETITISANMTAAEIYDFCQSELKAYPKLHLDDFYYTADNVNFETTYGITVNTGVTVTFTDKKLTCDSYTLTGTAVFTGVITDGTDIQVPVSLTDLVDGSVYGIFKTSDSSEIINGTVSGTSITTYYEHTAGSPVGITINVRHFTFGAAGTDYLPYTATDEIGDGVYSRKIEQQLDPITN